jgi:quercetin dioxygenase-like cupin family protein
MERTFLVTRVYADENGESHFQDIYIPLNENGEIGCLSDPQPSKNVIFREVEPSYHYDFHTALQRQYIVLLDGKIQIETSLGDTRIFKTGDVLLVEDIAGKGHRTKNIQPERRRSIFITI